jgi:hypothetical protein
MFDVKDAWNYMSDPFLRFRDENMIQTDEPVFYLKDLLLERFQKYCKSLGLPDSIIPLTINAFNNFISGNGFRQDRKRLYEKLRKGYSANWKFKPDSEYRITENDIMTACNSRDTVYFEK